MSAATLAAREHKQGCPVVLEPTRAGWRVESYVADRPAPRDPDTGYPTGRVTHVRVTRCQDCGEARYDDIDDQEATR